MGEKDTPTRNFWDARVYTNDTECPLPPPPGKLTGTAILVLGFFLLDWADTVGHIEIARS